MQFLYNIHSTALIIGIQKILEMPILNINDSFQKCYKGSYNFRKNQSKSYLVFFLKTSKILIQICQT